MSNKMLNENKIGYKKTKLGWIPEEWKIVSAEDISSVVTGGTPSKVKPEYWENGNINWMNSSEVNKKYIGKDDKRKAIYEKAMEGVRAFVEEYNREN